MKTPVLATALFALTAGLVFALPKTPPAPMPPPKPPAQTPIAVDQQRPRIEAVFVLDATGSMGGLIQAAKENIWSIASNMASAQPTPELRIGLVAFRDRGDDYVTRVFDLSTDLDSMYATLMDVQADGGGDHPEAVNKALYDAVHGMSWSQDASTYRTVFLVGDAPPQRYPDEPATEEVLTTAAARGILVNSIQAGNQPDTRQAWQQIASLGQGDYFQVGQQGSRIAVTTPFDDRIAALSKELDATRLFFGEPEAQAAMAAKQAAADKLHAGASPESRAKRAVFNTTAGGRGNLLGTNELVDAVSSGRVELDEIAPAHLPTPLRELSPEERERTIAQQAARRAEISAEIDRLGAERQAHIDASLAKQEGKEDSLDYRLLRTVQAQAAKKGLVYSPTAPRH